MKRVDRIIKFLEECGDPDIEASIGGLMGIGSEDRIKEFKDGLAKALEGEEWSHDLELEANKPQNSMLSEARAVLSAAGIGQGQSFESLNEAQMSAVRDEAAANYQQKYHKPMPADGADYVRKRYALIQKRAAR